VSTGMKNPVVKHLRTLGVKIVPEIIQSDTQHTQIDNHQNDIQPLEVSKMSEDLRSSIWKRLEGSGNLSLLLQRLFGTIKLRI